MGKHSPWLLLAVAVAATGAGAVAAEYTDARLVPESRVTPEYPPAALAARFDGSVTVEAQVRADGTVGDVLVTESSHPGIGFEEAAADAVQRWQFEPARLAGDPVESYQLYRLHFRSGVTGERSPYVSGQLLLSGLAPPALTKETSPAAGEGRIGTSQDRQRKRGVLKPTWPPACEGCMYDRTKLLPPQVRVVGTSQP
jgi:TonB family protein